MYYFFCGYLIINCYLSIFFSYFNLDVNIDFVIFFKIFVQVKNDFLFVIGIKMESELIEIDFWFFEDELYDNEIMQILS